MLVVRSPGDHLTSRIPLQELGADPAGIADQRVGIGSREHDALRGVECLGELEHTGRSGPSLQITQCLLGARGAGDGLGGRPGPPLTAQRLGVAEHARRLIRQSRGTTKAGGSADRLTTYVKP
ncbi:MAG TPA: hypothetical protein DHU96_00205 [Actinobacteria bacterium]|nr:hypothetical protein [Actinomycetota bacterium]